MPRKTLRNHPEIDRALSKQARIVLARRLSPELLRLCDLRVALNNPKDLEKQRKETEEEILRLCKHTLLIEIPRGRMERAGKLMVRPAMRFCLVCCNFEHAMEIRRKGRIRTKYRVLTARPLGQVRSQYGAITMTFGKRPMFDYVKAVLATEKLGVDVMNHIMYPGIYAEYLLQQ